MKANNGEDFEFMSEKQYERMHTKDPKCPYSDALRKNSDICGLWNSATVANGGKILYKDKISC